jgi:hypothetical protein
MKLGSSHDAYGEGGRGSASGAALSLTSVMQDLKEKFKNDEDDHCTWPTDKVGQCAVDEIL